jgi:hypothetical protein
MANTVAFPFSPQLSWPGPIMEELHRVLAADSRIVQIDEIATMHLGPQAILMALTLRFRSSMSGPGPTGRSR